MSLEGALSELTSGIPGCLASGVVDVRTGVVVTCKAAERTYREDFELIASGAAAVFDAAPTALLEGLTDRGHENHQAAAFREVTLVTENRLQVFCRPEHNPDLVLLILCSTASSIGMVLAKARLQLMAIEAQLS